jgi:DNA-binding sugar fermentation-stimulating protein
MVKVALENELIEECVGFTTLKTEIKIDDSRIDFELGYDSKHDTKEMASSRCKKRKRAKVHESPSCKRMLVEVKSVTLAGHTPGKKESDCIAEFPDSVSTRASKHANTLKSHVLSGGRAAILFLIQRADVTSFTISSLDQTYQQAIREAAAAGVLMLPYKCSLCPETGHVSLLGKVPYIEPPIA